MIKNKKADLLNNVLSTILVVIGLAIILFAAYKLYSVYANQDETNAQNIANVLEAKINSVDSGQFASFAVKGVNTWYVAAWNKEDSNRPDKCYFSNCICVCKATPGTSPTSLGLAYHSSANCQDAGYCRLFKDKTVYAFTIFNSQTGPSVTESNVLDFLKNANFKAGIQDSNYKAIEDSAYGYFRAFKPFSYSSQGANSIFLYDPWGLAFENSNLNGIYLYEDDSTIRLATISQHQLTDYSSGKGIAGFG